MRSMTHCGLSSLLLDGDVCDIPKVLTRSFNGAIQDLRSAHTGNGSPDPLGFQKCVHLLKKKPRKYPENPESYLEDRLESITNSGSPISSLPLDKRTDIARAGFFSKGGRGTTLTCYHCGCSARDWRADDDPWLIHAGLQPNCPVIQRGVDMFQGPEKHSDTTLKRTISCPDIALNGILNKSE